MTQKEHDVLARFAEFNFKKIFGINQKFTDAEPIEFFYEAYSKKPIDIHEAIVREIYDHYYKTIGSIQKSSKNGNCEKKCNGCKKTLQKDSFLIKYDRKNDFHFLSYKCKECLSADKKKKMLDLEYREKVNQKKREYYQKNKEKHLERGKIWAANNKDKVNASTKKWRENNKEKMKEIHRNYELNNKEKIALRKKIRRNQKNNQL